MDLRTLSLKKRGSKGDSKELQDYYEETKNTIEKVQNIIGKYPLMLFIKHVFPGLIYASNGEFKKFEKLNEITQNILQMIALKHPNDLEQFIESRLKILTIINYHYPSIIQQEKLFLTSEGLKSEVAYLNYIMSEVENFDVLIPTEALISMGLFQERIGYMYNMSNIDNIANNFLLLIQHVPSMVTNAPQSTKFLLTSMLIDFQSGRIDATWSSLAMGVWAFKYFYEAKHKVFSLLFDENLKSVGLEQVLFRLFDKIYSLRDGDRDKIRKLSETIKAVKGIDIHKEIHNNFGEHSLQLVRYLNGQQPGDKDLKTLESYLVEIFEPEKHIKQMFEFYQSKPDIPELSNVIIEILPLLGNKLYAQVLKKKKIIKGIIDEAKDTDRGFYHLIFLRMIQNSESGMYGSIVRELSSNIQEEKYDYLKILLSLMETLELDEVVGEEFGQMRTLIEEGGLTDALFSKVKLATRQVMVKMEMEGQITDWIDIKLKYDYHEKNYEEKAERLAVNWVNTISSLESFDRLLEWIGNTQKLPDILTELTPMLHQRLWTKTDELLKFYGFRKLNALDEGKIISDGVKVWWYELGPKKLRDDSMITNINRRNTGGIDLNANTLPLDVQGGGIDFNFPIPTELCIDEDNDGSCERMDINALESMPITGFTPVIFQIIPITNLGVNGHVKMYQKGTRKVYQ